MAALDRTRADDGLGVALLSALIHELALQGLVDLTRVSRLAVIGLGRLEARDDPEPRDQLLLPFPTDDMVAHEGDTGR